MSTWAIKNLGTVLKNVKDRYYDSELDDAPALPTTLTKKAAAQQTHANALVWFGRTLYKLTRKPTTSHFDDLRGLVPKEAVVAADRRPEMLPTFEGIVELLAHAEPVVVPILFRYIRAHWAITGECLTLAECKKVGVASAVLEAKEGAETISRLEALADAIGDVGDDLEVVLDLVAYGEEEAPIVAKVDVWLSGAAGVAWLARSKEEHEIEACLLARGISDEADEEDACLERKYAVVLGGSVLDVDNDGQPLREVPWMIKNPPDLILGDLPLDLKAKRDYKAELAVIRLADEKLKKIFEGHYEEGRKWRQGRAKRQAGYDQSLRDLEKQATARTAVFEENVEIIAKVAEKANTKAVINFGLARTVLAIKATMTELMGDRCLGPPERTDLEGAASYYDHVLPDHGGEEGGILVSGADWPPGSVATPLAMARSFGADAIILYGPAANRRATQLIVEDPEIRTIHRIQCLSSQERALEHADAAECYTCVLLGKKDLADSLWTTWRKGAEEACPFLREFGDAASVLSASPSLYPPYAPPAVLQFSDPRDFDVPRSERPRRAKGMPGYLASSAAAILSHEVKSNLARRKRPNPSKCVVFEATGFLDTCNIIDQGGLSVTVLLAADDPEKDPSFNLLCHEAMTRGVDTALALKQKFAPTDDEEPRDEFETERSMSLLLKAASLARMGLHCKTRATKLTFDLEAYSLVANLTPGWKLGDLALKKLGRLKVGPSSGFMLGPDGKKVRVGDGVFTKEPLESGYYFPAETHLVTDGELARGATKYDYDLYVGGYKPLGPKRPSPMDLGLRVAMVPGSVASFINDHHDLEDVDGAPVEMNCGIMRESNDGFVHYVVKLSKDVPKVRAWRLVLLFDIAFSKDLIILFSCRGGSFSWTTGPCTGSTSRHQSPGRCATR